MRKMLPDDEIRTTDLHTTRAAIGAFIVGWLALAWPWLSGRFTIPYDATAQFLPQIQFLAASLWRGESPFWNPFVFSGHPQIADPQSMMFSPPFLALAVLTGDPSAWAVDATVYVSILVGGIALIVWFRDQGWHGVGAVVAALVFGFGAAMAWRIQHTGQVLSLVFLAITLCWLDRAIARGSWNYGLAAGVAGACLVLGRDQVALQHRAEVVAQRGTHLRSSGAVQWVAATAFTLNCILSFCVERTALCTWLIALGALVDEALEGAIADDLLQPKHHGRGRFVRPRNGMLPAQIVGAGICTGGLFGLPGGLLAANRARLLVSISAHGLTSE